MSRGIIIGAVIVGCDQRLTDGAYCPKLQPLDDVDGIGLHPTCSEPAEVAR